MRYSDLQQWLDSHSTIRRINVEYQKEDRFHTLTVNGRHRLQIIASDSVYNPVDEEYCKTNVSTDALIKQLRDLSAASKSSFEVVKGAPPPPPPHEFKTPKALKAADYYRSFLNHNQLREYSVSSDEWYDKSLVTTVYSDDTRPPADRPPFSLVDDKNYVKPLILNPTDEALMRYTVQRWRKFRIYG